MTPPERGSVEECTVAEFSERFARMLAGHRALSRIAIVGEITEIKRWPDGNVNLVLKEGSAVLSCFAFASQARRFPPIREGVLVRAEGSIEIRANRSLYQLHAQTIALVGAGKLAAQIEELRMRLRAEGAFDASRKREVPAYPRRVALVTSDDDARADFEAKLRADAPHVDVLFFRTRVQGKGADIDIAEAMGRASRAAVDVIVLTRGGGSSEDRLTFNLEAVVRAVLRSQHPVVTAVGHHRDHHLADEVADLALATPTAAAGHLGHEWLRSFDTLGRLRVALARGYGTTVGGKLQSLRESDAALTEAARGVVRGCLERLRRSEREVDRRSPMAHLNARQIRLVRSAAALDRAIERRGERARGSLARAAAALDVVDPTSPLARGFAIVTKDGIALHDAGELSPGDAVRARLARGTFEARVESVRPE